MAEFNRPPLLQQGRNNPEWVRVLQVLLNQRINAGLGVDGIFGPATKSAVQNFQRLYGLEVDGIVGPKTWDALLSASSTPTSTASNTNQSTISPVMQSPGQGTPPLRDSYLRDLYHRNVRVLPQLQFISGMEQELEAFKNVWNNYRQRYEKVADIVYIPAELIAAIHYREGSNNFNTYLHNGDPLGQPTVHVPKGIFFTVWEDAAVHAIQEKDDVRKDLGLTRHSTDIAAIAAFAEYYNGLGYRKKGIFSPYVFSGTNLYSWGLYVADHKFDPGRKDSRPGILALMREIGFQFSVTGSAQQRPPTPAPSQHAVTPEVLAQVIFVNAQNQVHYYEINAGGCPLHHEITPPWWANFQWRIVLPSSDRVIYGVTQDGKLYWMKFLGQNNTGQMFWDVPQFVGHWPYDSMIPTNKGVIYAVDKDRSLLWFKHLGFTSGGQEMDGPRRVGTNWNFIKIFSGGNGILYALKQEGELYWYKHKDWEENPQEVPNQRWNYSLVGRGFNEYNLFSAGSGVILGIHNQTRALHWFCHEGFHNGAWKWTTKNHGTQVGQNWNPLTRNTVGAILNPIHLPKFSFKPLPKDKPPGQIAAEYALRQYEKKAKYSQDPKLRLGPYFFDCSGLVFKAWENAGRIVPPTTHCYPNSKLVRECRSDEPLQPGDILWRQGHVGIYVGEGMVVHASGKKYGVKKDPLAQFKYTKRYRPHGV